MSIRERVSKSEAAVIVASTLALCGIIYGIATNNTQLVSDLAMIGAGFLLGKTAMKR